MFLNAVALLRQHPAQLDENTDVYAAAAAYRILRTLNEPLSDAQAVYRAARGSTDEGEPADGYARWKEHFDVSSSQVPDEMVDILRKITRSTIDEDGSKFWRVRRLEELALRSEGSQKVA